jgi:hypothetical protein
MRGDMRKERRVKEVARGAVPWHQKYERRNRPHDYSVSIPKPVDHSYPYQYQRE